MSEKGAGLVGATTKNVISFRTGLTQSGSAR